MYGTIFKMTVKSGQAGAVEKLFAEWERERQPNVKGAIGGLLLRPDNRPDELFGAAVFKDKDSYMANAGDPEQDGWYRRLRELLETDPEWRDGEYLMASLS